MPFLEDGSCAPSHAPLAYMTERLGGVGSFLDDNVSLKTGYVVAAHYPGDKGYEHAKTVVYDITSPTSLQSGGLVWMTYYNASWGAAAVSSIQDFTRVRLNVPKGWTNGKPLTQELLDEASYVAFLCNNGRSQNAIIVGLMEHPSLIPDDKELGHYFAQSFNGIQTLINKDGEYSVTFTGAILDPETNAYIEPPEETTGTTIALDKEGSLLLDNVKGESIKLDKKEKLVKVSARSMTVDVTDKDYKTTGKGKITFLSQSNAVFNGKKVYIGKEGSTEPLVLGNKLVNALKALVNAIQNSAEIGKLGAAPVAISPVLKANLAMWMAQYGTPTAPFLSRKGFVE